ncbi:hypothetical protein Acsp03_71750 [Actinomadura sp. NBRC 104412]|uniref:hypothetical protein n=1 Tax=Actinomadura sp. NBRC 104412 TaxID=3032203 RepID=UPI0024A2C147|nr:hypothetical protein [Actinomadura sp. NBRC 104412]GLZ09709.1 hypothetical protein Acsp03_71750 [Actinomadura sp. NBRC 104412]
MIDLTDELLQPRPGTIRYHPADLDSPTAGTWSIEIPLAPFSADDEYRPATFRSGSGGPKLIQTAIRLDFIELPTDHLSALSKRTFTFPVNPQDGYIDGSVYLLHTHNPVDVTRIDFGEMNSDQIPARLHAYFDFGDGINDLRNRNAVLETVLRFKPGRPVRSGTS